MNNFMKFLIPIVLSLLTYQLFKHTNIIKVFDSMKTPREIQLESLDQRIGYWNMTSSTKYSEFEYIVKTGNELISQLKMVRAKLFALSDDVTEQILAQVKLEFDAIDDDFSDFWFHVLSLEFHKFDAVSIAAFRYTLDSDNHQMPTRSDIVGRVIDILELEELHTALTVDHEREAVESKLALAYKTIQVELDTWWKIIEKNGDFELFCAGSRRPETGNRDAEKVREAEQDSQESFRQLTQLFPVGSYGKIVKVLHAASVYSRDLKTLKNIICSDVV